MQPDHELQWNRGPLGPRTEFLGGPCSRTVDSSACLRRSSQFAGVVALLAALACPLTAQTVPVKTPAPIDVTFAFIADVHVGYNGANDGELIQDYGEDNFLLGREASGDSCADYSQSGVYDLCTQIQEVRKLNALALPNNTWPAGLRTGGPINVSGVVIGGDLTDCGGGGLGPASFHGNSCSDYGSPYNGQQLLAFKKMYDRTASQTIPLKIAAMQFLTGLKNPDADLPLRYPIYPGFGNHDLNFYNSGEMQDYVGSWNPLNVFMPGIKISNSDPDSKSYSWDWGGLHLINVGVFAGSDDGDYQFSSNSLAWLQNDLKTYAGDGRPVIIFQHFGFDPKWGLGWYNDGGRIGGLDGLFDSIKDYNVIGLFTGHYHAHLGHYSYPWQLNAQGQWWPNTPRSWYPDWQSKLPSGSPELPLSPYDIFHPGQAYAENLALVHVTNDRIDVTFGDNSHDFNNTTKQVSFFDSVSKDLTPAPALASSLQFGATVTQNSTFVRSNGKPYLVTIGGGGYKVAAYNRDGTQRQTATGSLSSLGLPFTVWALGVSGKLTPSPDGRIFMSALDTIYAFDLDAAGRLSTAWAYNVGIAPESLMAFQYRQQTYLLASQNSDARTVVYLVNEAAGGSHLSVVESTYLDQSGNVPVAPGLKGYVNGAQFIPYTGTDSTPRFLRYDPVFGTMEYYTAVDGNGSVRLSKVNVESTWGPRASLIQPVAMYDGSTSFVVVSNACFTGAELISGFSQTAPTYCSPESPVLLRKLQADNQSSVIAWRGNPGVPAIGAMTPLSTSSGSKSAFFGVASTASLFGTLGFSYVLALRSPQAE